MIVFDLKCGSGHVFECWFGSSSDFESQKEQGFLSCPHCTDTDISKAVMAPNVAAKGNTRVDVEPAAGHAPSTNMPTLANAMASGAEIPAELQQGMDEILQKIRTHVESNCDNVGKGFAEEARKIHYGEAEERGIYGETTPEETRDLIEEGVDIMPLPGRRRVDA